MTITFLDTLPTNPGDLSWEDFEVLGTVQRFERSAPDQVMERIMDSDIIVTNKVILGAEHLQTAKNLKLITVLATGYNNVDVEAARKRGITVCNVPAYSTDSTAQTTIALLLELTQNVGLHHQSIQNGDWFESPAFCYWKKPLMELAGKTLVIVGMGNIGKKVAAIAEALGMKILCISLRGNAEGPYPYVGVEGGLTKADVLTFHCPLTEENRGFLNADRLKLMKPTAFVINASRGPLVHEGDLAEALKSGHIAGYAADVLSSEPPSKDNPLLGLDNCILTPHIGWATFESRQRLWDATLENVRLFFDGRPQNTV